MQVASTQIKTMRLSQEVIQGVSAIAKVENRSFTNMVETILRKEIRNEENKKERVR